VSSLYTFHCFGSDGAPIAMQSAPFPTYAAAIAYIERVLAEHLSAASVLVCEADRQVAKRQRTTVT